jgi:rod shape-determining protein MreD
MASYQKSDNPGARLDQFARFSVPAASAFLLSFLSAVPVPLPGFAAVKPAWALVAVFYWSLHRPDLFGPVTLFLLGLMQDVITGAPTGLHAFLYLVGYGVLLTFHRYIANATFYSLWAFFGLFALGVMIVHWTLVSVLEVHPMPIAPQLFRTAMTVGLYPLLTWILIKIHHGVLQSGE